MAPYYFPHHLLYLFSVLCMFNTPPLYHFVSITKLLYNAAWFSGYWRIPICGRNYSSLLQCNCFAN